VGGFFGGAVSEDEALAAIEGALDGDGASGTAAASPPPAPPPLVADASSSTEPRTAASE
jgi:hypothetical protein